MKLSTVRNVMYASSFIHAVRTRTMATTSSTTPSSSRASLLLLIGTGASRARPARPQRALCGIALEIARAEPPLIVFEDRRHLIGALGDLVGACRLARRMPFHRYLGARVAEYAAKGTTALADEHDRGLRSADGVRVDHILIVVLLDVDQNVITSSTIAAPQTSIVFIEVCGAPMVYELITF